MPDTGSLVYDDLTAAGRQIRLLRLKLDGQRDSIECELCTFDLTQAPKYAAISYTWGQPSLVRHILIGENEILVRQNCFYALWQARLFGLYEYVWIDAICINQDNLREKGHQVAMMGDVFAGADAVLASLGSHKDDSQEVVAVTTTARDAEVKAALLESISGPLEEVLVKTRGTMRFLRALQAFSHREYWQRVWVVQEVMVARAIHILCGEDVIDWAELASFLEGAGKIPHVIMLETTHGKPDRRRSVRMRKGPMWAVMDARLASQLPLEVIVNKFNTWFCSHPLDRIYGFLQAQGFFIERRSDLPRLFEISTRRLDRMHGQTGLA